MKNLHMLMDDLMGQTNFVKVIKKAPDWIRNRLCFLLVYGDEDQAYQLIRVAELKIDEYLIQCALEGFHPEKLRNLLAQAHNCPEQVGYTRAEVQERISGYLKLNEKKLQGSKTKDDWEKFLKTFLEQGSQ